jgi:hypothetical protein
LTVEARPQWARIFVNGQDWGPSPIFRHKAPIGPAVVEGVRADGSRQKRHVNVASQKESIVVIEW